MLPGGDAVLSGVDEAVCGVSLVMAAGVLDLCGVDTVAAGVDGSVCCVNSVMTAGELDICVYDSVVSDETGDSSGVEVVVSVYDVVACGDDPLLPDAVRVGGWLSVVGGTLVCGAGVARSGRGDTEVVVGQGVAQAGWVDRLICADGSLRPEPPHMHAMCLMAIVSAFKSLCKRLVGNPYTYLRCIVYCFLFRVLYHRDG